MVADDLYEKHLKSLGGEPYFKTREEQERFNQTFRLGCLIALNSGPTATRFGTLPAGRYTREIVSLYEFVKKEYPGYKLSEESVEELKPFLVGPYAHVLAA
jgi:hypothetical protein